MDIASTTQPKSDQQNFDDYVAGPKTVTVSEVTAGNAEQPVEIHLTEFPGRPFKPSKSMRRVLIAAWGAEASAYTGRRMTLYGDPTIKFGGQVVGGIRISHLSHIDGPVSVNLTVSRGKRAPFVVQPLKDAPAPQAKIDAALNAIRNAPDTTELNRIETHADSIGIGDHIRAALTQRRDELGGVQEVKDTA